jgi:HSP20 family molecular chaperone IbpA
VSQRSDIGVWVVGAVALIALVVFGGMWLMQTRLVLKLDGISRETRQQNKQLQDKVAALQGEVKKLEAQLGEREQGDETNAAAAEETGDQPVSKARGRVYVRVKSRPTNARVRRGGRTLGRTPLVLPMGRDETAKLVLQLAGHAEQQVEVRAEDGASVTVRLKRKPAKGKGESALFDPYK